MLERRIHNREHRAMKKIAGPIRLFVIFGGIVGISYLHYFTPLSQPVLHNILQRLYYLPIILAAFWFGFKGGIGAALIVSILYAPHIFFQWGGHPEMGIDMYLEILIYNLVGGVTGFLSQQEKYRRKQLENTAAGLEESYRTLQQQSELIIRTEERLRRAERLSVLGELAAVLAHEIRNPLGSIRGTAEILKDDYQPGDKKYEFLEILLKESDRLNRVVEDFLKLSRPQPLTLAPCNLTGELKSVVMLVMGEAKDRGLRLELHADEVLSIRGDKDKLHQAFLNIILNGTQSMSTGDSLIIEAQMRQDGSANHSEVQIIFRDTGSGIPENVLKNIFEPFFTTKQEGTGLGLAIAKRIIEAHNGRIDVSANTPKGAIFTIRLPVDPPAPADAAQNETITEKNK
jgi:two-component system, NtrC family, sensor histidine kinase HydH